MAQKLDHVMSSICWCIVLLEDKHISINAADHQQHFLHQQNLSVLLPVDFSSRFNGNEVGSMVANHCSGSESLVVVTTLLFLTILTSAICRRRFADVPAGSDVADSRCPMRTSPKP